MTEEVGCKNVLVDRGGVFSNPIQEMGSETGGVVAGVVDHTRIPNFVKFSFTSEEGAVDSVTSEIFGPSYVKRLVNITSEVDEESDGRRLGIGSIIRPRSVRKLLGEQGIVLNSSNNANLVEAVAIIILEVSRASRHVDVV